MRTEPQIIKGCMPAKNEFRIEGDIVWIKLTQGKETCIDLVDWPLVREHRWHVQISKTGKAYAVTHKRKRPFLTAILMHCLIVGHRAKDTDHEDGDGLNNRRYNLRPCTRSQNQANVGLSRRNTSGIKGVSWHKGKNKWCARIRFQGVLRSLGGFSNREEAANAYTVAAKKLYGEFAYKGLV